MAAGRSSPVFSEAVRAFWKTRTLQAAGQRQRGKSDQGARGAVTGGRQMDGFARTLSEALLSAGVGSGDIHRRRRVEIPGYYRPTKQWDLLVVVKGALLAAIELKSQVGPSFGNNFNNRTEEAMGSALDTWTAYREGAFSAAPAPWLGYLLHLGELSSIADLSESARATLSRVPGVSGSVLRQAIRSLLPQTGPRTSIQRGVLPHGGPA